MDLQQVMNEVKGLITQQAELHKAALEDVKQFQTGVKSEWKEKLDAMAKECEKLTNAYTDYQKDHSELKSKNEALETRLKEAEARLNRKGTDDDPDDRRVKTFGQLVAENAEVKKAIEERRFETRGRVLKVELAGRSLKDLISTDQGQYLIREQRLAGIQAQPQIPMTARDLIPSTGTTSNAIEYVKEQAGTNNAGPQYEAPGVGNVPPAKYEGAKKNKSDLSYTLVTTNVKTIAHYMKASKQIMADAPQLQGYIDNRLRYFLALEEDDELLLGDGAAGAILGLIPQSSAYDTNLNVANDTKIDTIAHAMLQVTDSLFMPTGTVLNPRDWHAISLIKTNEGQVANNGTYLISQPTGTAPLRLWGYPVLPSLKMPAGEFLTGNFQLGAQIFDRELPSVTIATTNEDDFIRNMITILCEERLALAVYRQDAFVHGDFPI